MWVPNPKASNAGKRLGRNGLVAVAIEKDKSSQYALRWTVDNLIVRGQTVILIHVVQKSAAASVGNMGAIHDANGTISAQKNQLEKQTKELFLTFHCFCTRKDVQCYDVILEDTDIAKAITEYVSYGAIENLVLGSSGHGFIRRLKTIDTPTAALKVAPDFCTVYVISKTKISQVRNASRLAPFTSPIFNQMQQLQDQVSNNGCSPNIITKHNPSIRDAEMTPRNMTPRNMTPQRPFSMRDDSYFIRSPFAKARGLNGKLHGELSESESDISFISSERPSVDRMSALYDSVDSGLTSRISTSSDSSISSERFGTKGSDISSFHEFSSSSIENDDVEVEMRRLKLELQRTMDMYSTACKEALSAKEKATELHRWRIEEERRLKEARLAEEIAEMEKSKFESATETAEVSEKKALEEEEEEKHNVIFRYRRYTIEEIEEATENLKDSYKIGEGGYGPVYKCYLDHTAVAVKVLRPDATQGREQFQQEVEVLSCMRHPNMVLLLGACPEYGCLVYEYMANGSLDDRLFRRGNTPALSWQLRFRIAAEIATGLLFLHRTKPEPLVHRDLKPANILLDHNFVSKIGDVGLARLVPPSVADNVTQYRMTSAAGTFCYIDPEYQQTGMLGVKSDVYSLGIIFLQIITAKPAMGLTHHVGRAIENGTFSEMLDPNVPDWPVEEALSIAKIGLQCAELRRKDRPDLDNVVLPELNRLRELADESMSHLLLGGSYSAAGPSPN